MNRTRMEELRQMGRGLKCSRIVIIYLKSHVLFGIYSFFHTPVPDTVFVGVWAMDMHVHNFVCVFSLSCVIAALLCLCRGSVDMRKKGRIAKPPTVT